MKCFSIFFILASLSALPIHNVHADEVETLAKTGSPSTGKAYVSTFGPINVPITYSKIGDLAVFEGDIVLGTQKQVDTQKRLVEDSRSLRRIPQGSIPFGIYVAGEYFRWPDSILFYEIEDGFPNKDRILDAMKHWESKTPIRFKQRVNESNFVMFIKPDDGEGCAAVVGMRGGQQKVWIGDSCTIGNIIHEIGHALGLWHEQSRSDRDAHIKIDWDNIAEDEKKNFDQHVTDGIDSGAYDYESIMHYPANAFAIDNKRPTITSPKPIGQRKGLSDGDRTAITSMYTQ